MPWGYVVLDPADMDAVEPKNHHVIKAWKDRNTGALSYPDGYTVLDGEFDMDPQADIRRYQILPKDDSALRTALANMQNEGESVCGNCARHFYAGSSHA